MKKSQSNQLQLQKLTQREYSSLITRKGQITIPIQIRTFLEFNEGDRVSILMDEDRRTFFKKSTSVVARTAGMLKTNKKPLSAKQMRDFAEVEIAEATVARSEA